MMKVLEVQEKGKEEESRVKVDTDSSPGFIHLSPKVFMNVNITPCAKWCSHSHINSFFKYLLGIY